MKTKSLLLLLLLTSIVSLAQKQKYFIEITFKDGDFKGTHVFTPEKGNYLSQINLEFFDGYSNLNASKLVAENGLQIHYINRTFLGEAKRGTHKTKNFTKGCGSLNFIDLKNKQPYKKINGDFTSCTSTKITEVSSWKKSYVKSKRNVSGSFSDTVTFEYRMDDGSKKTTTAKVVVKFTARESRRI